MRGPDHYRLAEDLLEAAENQELVAHQTALVATAQVHATLALVSATLDARHHRTGETPRQDERWMDAGL